MNEKQNSGGAKRTVKILAIMLAFCTMAIGAYVVYTRFFGRDIDIDIFSEQEQGEPTFVQGVSIAGVNLAGKTMSEARQTLNIVENRMSFDVHFAISTETSSVTLTSSDLELIFDTDEVLNEAIKLGNEGTRAEKEQAREEILANNIDLPITMNINVEPARAIITELAEELKREPVNATVEPDLNHQGWFRYTQGEQGVYLDEQALMDELIKLAQEKDYGVVQAPLVRYDPEITVDKLKEKLVLRSYAYTSFKKSPYNREDRVFNVKRASGCINGTILKPGEVFSTNDVLGPRTYALGWKAAPAYVSGATEDQAGGGVCQVSSTLYSAVVRADLEIVYRRNHSSPVGYVSRGLDATINTGTIDFQFKNNTENDIYIFSYTYDSKDAKLLENQEDKTIHVEIYGDPFPEEYDEIQLSSEKLQTVTPKGAVQYVLDASQPADYYNEEVKRQDGSVWQSYKHYFKNGVEVKKEKLAKSTYNAYNGRIIVGSGYAAASAGVAAAAAQ